MLKIFKFKKVTLLAISIAVGVSVFAFYDHDVKAAKADSVAPIVCLDPGHGGIDPGAQANGLTESDINLKVAFITESLLKAKGYIVVMTRTADVYLSHAQRAEFCNAHHAAVLVAIHQNDYPYGNADYSTALYYKSKDLALATALANSVGHELGLSITPPSYFVGGVLMHSTMPATLIEGLFITNNNEVNSIKHGDRLSRQAQGIASGIVNYLHTQPGV